MSSSYVDVWMVRSPEVDGEYERGGVSGLDVPLLILSDEEYGTWV
jgi:hypothetical protein